MVLLVTASKLLIFVNLNEVSGAKVLLEITTQEGAPPVPLQSHPRSFSLPSASLCPLLCHPLLLPTLMSTQTPGDLALASVYLMRKSHQRSSGREPSQSGHNLPSHAGHRGALISVTTHRKTWLTHYQLYPTAAQISGVGL